MMRTLMAGLAMLALAPCAAAQETEITFTAQSGESVVAYEGRFDVPESREDPDSRMLSLAYVRFPATGSDPGSPIVYLSGGPGGSGIGTARGRRFPLFMAMREFGDVIALDQRGTGDSNDIERCVSSVSIPDAEAITDDEYADAYRAAAEECRAVWIGQGVDIEAYTTVESAHDLSDLRRHLGADRVSLWGISYGTHLALAAMRQMPGEIDRVILASAEGLDQTVKLPSRTDAYFARLQDAVNTQPAAAAAYPDIAGLMRRVQSRLEAEPVLLQIPLEDGSIAPFLLQRRTMQEAASMLIADPGSAAILLALYASVDQGDYRLATGLLQRMHSPGEPIGLWGMSTAMDLASGISDARLEQFEAEAATGLVGPYLNAPMPQIRGVWDGFDLGEDFRQPPVSDIPTLLLTGTLDGRTYPEGQIEAVSGLTRVTRITVENAGHNLFMTSPEVGEAMARFMRGQSPVGDTITVELPDFTELPF
ncbi:MAG: alpha/beta hydrolase [Maricaulis sp.]|nr:alpha/beta hydrolase [Maricaulis sp.]